ncbi:hypothetical protein EDF39_3408 [Frondihabitans sp. PhB161]|nr:hypothetical protein EDF39_3408 [Frondihabitans sp. PhB161]
MGWKVTVREADAILLASPMGFQLFLISAGHRARHASLGVGTHHLMWAADTADSLDQFEQLLRGNAQGGNFVDRHVTDGVTFVEGHDPDQIRLILCYPGPHLKPRTVIDSRLFT